MSILIRLASNSDIHGVVGVIKTVYDEFGFSWHPEGYHADLYDLDAFYSLEHSPFFVAESEGQILGTVALELFNPIPGERAKLGQHEDRVRILGSDCSLERLYVHPNGRRKGIGKALTNHVIQLAKQRGRTLMEIWSDKAFVDAHRLYERFGAKLVGERLCHDPDQSPEWGMAIPLTD